LPEPKHYGPRGFLGRQDNLHLLHFAGQRPMADGLRENGNDRNRSAEEAALSARLKRLGKRLDQKSLSRPDEASPRSSTDASALARGFRLSTELVAGVLVGAFIGWALDRWLGISPWGMIVFLLLGFSAGVVNVMRAAGVSGGPGSAK
jgi:ATP synthase protein I